MKINAVQLRRLIKEEISKSIRENFWEDEARRQKEDEARMAKLGILPREKRGTLQDIEKIINDILTKIGSEGELSVMGHTGTTFIGKGPKTWGGNRMEDFSNDQQGMKHWITILNSTKHNSSGKRFEPHPQHPTRWIVTTEVADAWRDRGEEEWAAASPPRQRSDEDR